MKTSLTALAAALLASISLAHPAAAQPHLYLDREIIEFNAARSTDSFRVENDGTGLLTWSITTDRTWIVAAPLSGANEAGEFTSIQVTVDRAGLADGYYSGRVNVSSNGGNDDVIVRMRVQNAPKLDVPDTWLTLTPEVPSYELSITNAGIAPLEGTVTPDDPWIDVTPSEFFDISFGEPQILQIGLDMGSLPSPDVAHTGHITIDSNGGSKAVTVRYLPAPPSPGMLGVYADVAGTDCNIVGSTPGLKQVHIVHTRTDGATASQFSAPKPACWTNAMYLSDVNMFPVTVGNSQTGTSVPYGSCKAPMTYVMGINYFIMGPPTQFCCPYPVLPDPYVPSGRIEMADCDFNLMYGVGATAIVNPNASCPCQSPPVAAEETTWGRVKSLYAPK